MRIFVIDDSEDDRMLAVRELRRGLPEATLCEVESENELNAAFKAGTPALVVTDYRMGWMDGLGVLRTVKAGNRDIPVIMLTGTMGEGVAVAAMREGVDDYLFKTRADYARLAEAARSAIEKAAVRAAERRAQSRFEELFRNVPVGLAVCREDGSIVEANEAMAQILGDGERASLARLRGKDVPEAWTEAVRGGAPEIQVRRSDGLEVSAILRVRPVEHPLGDEPLLEAAVTDITAVRKAQEERTVLLAELAHRVNNNLQMVTSFLVSLAGKANDPGMRRAIEEMSSRVHSISLVQSSLYRSGDYANVNLKSFLEELLPSMLQGSEVRAQFDADNVVVPVHRAIPVGLIANELLLNALKHAFPGVAGPELRVALKASDGSACGEDGRVSLVVADNGVGMPEDPARAAKAGGGYGSRLLRALARQVNGTIQTTSAPGSGTSVAVFFPDR